MNAYEIEMSEKERRDISSLIETRFGIKMPPVKKVLLTSRLSKRLNVLGFNSYSEYYRYLVSGGCSADEFNIFTDLVSTHETSFFREPQHFDYLYKTALPQLLEDNGAGVKKQLRVLSSACSTGEEAYTISVILEEFIKNNNQNNYSYRITGTDISSKVVNYAVRAVYHESRVGGLSPDYLRRYFMKGKGSKSEFVRVIPEIRSLSEFFCMNLMDEHYPFRDKFDIIFFRNAMIYFDKENQAKILSRLAGHLKNGGLLMTGHSETLSDYKLPFRCVAPAIYRKV